MMNISRTFRTPVELEGYLRGISKDAAGVWKNNVSRLVTIVATPEIVRNKHRDRFADHPKES